MLVSDSLNKVNLSSSPMFIAALSFQTNVKSRNSLQGVFQSQMLQTSFTDLEDQIRRTARTMFSQLEITEKSLRVGLEDQRQHKTALHQIRKSLDEDHVNRRALNNQVQALEVLLKEVRDDQQVQAQFLQEFERNVIQYHETDEKRSHQSRAVEAGLTQQLGRYRPQVKLLPYAEESQLHPNLNPTMSVPGRSLGQSEGYNQPFLTPRTREDPATALFPSTRGSLSNIIPIKLTSNRCDSACGYVCHRRCQFKSPRGLNALLGSLFVGYQASPWSSQMCSNSGCRQRSKKLTYVYAFPQWFLARILVVDMAYSQSKGPELCLRSMRVRSSVTGGFGILLARLSEHNRLHHFKRLINDGQISVLDVEEQGITILHVRPS